MAKSKGTDFTSLFATLGEDIKTGLSSALDKVLGSTLPSFGNKFETGLTSIMNQVATKALTPLTAATNLYVAAASGAIHMIENFVAKANPAAAFQFNRALDDLAGTMGQILTPVLNAITGFIREFADVLQGLRPAMAPIMDGFSAIIKSLSSLILPIASAMQPVFNTLAAIIQSVAVPAIAQVTKLFESMAPVIEVVFGEIADLVIPIIEELKPAFRELADIMRPLFVQALITELNILKPIFEILASVIKEVVVPAIRYLVEVLKKFRELIGEFNLPEFKPSLEKSSSVGAAIRPAAYGKIEDIGKRTTLSALNVGRGAGLTPDGKATTDGIKKTNEILGNIDKNLQKRKPSVSVVGGGDF